MYYQYPVENVTEAMQNSIVLFYMFCDPTWTI